MMGLTDMMKMTVIMGITKMIGLTDMMNMRLDPHDGPDRYVEHNSHNGHN